MTALFSSPTNNHTTPHMGLYVVCIVIALRLHAINARRNNSSNSKNNNNTNNNSNQHQARRHEAM